MERVFALFDWSCKGSVSCPNRRVAWLVTTNLPDPESCYEHLSEEQRAAFNAASAAVQERMQQLRNEPDCWSWPVPEPREYADETEAGDALHEWQHEYGCAICGGIGPLVTDHNHETGLVRGNLCHACNIKEGKGYSTPPFEKYRERPPAAILGVSVRYWSPFTGYAEPRAPETAEDRAAAKAAVDRLSLPSLPSLPSLESLRDAEPLPQEASET
jgi:hypothetical protein